MHPDETIRNYERILKVFKQQADWVPLVVEIFEARSADDDWAHGRFIALRTHPLRRGVQYVAGRFTCRADRFGGPYCYTVSYDMERKRADEIFNLLGA